MTTYVLCIIIISLCVCSDSLYILHTHDTIYYNTAAVV
jgi:hypothetical protein